jgi:hypothetical protein
MRGFAEEGLALAVGQAGMNSDQFPVDALSGQSRIGDVALMARLKSRAPSKECFFISVMLVPSPNRLNQFFYC